MKHAAKLLVVAILTLLSLSSRAEEPIDVSIIRLVATPSEYQGRLVRIVGFLHTGFEDNGIYINKEDHQQSLYINGLWLDLSGNTQALASKLNNKYVLVVGTFSPTNTGHLGLWSGALTNIQRIAPWNNRQETP